MQYMIVIEKTAKNFSAYAPDIPGCVATGATRNEVVSEMQTAIGFHLEGLRKRREPIPAPSCSTEMVSIATAV